MTRVDRPRRADRFHPIAIVAAGLLLLAGCGNAASSGQPSGASSPGRDIRIIEASTQLQLDGVAIGVGNIFEEPYAPPGGTPTVGLTAALFVTVKSDTSQNRTERVGAGQEVDVPGYRLRIISVEAGRIQVEVVERPS